MNDLVAAPEEQGWHEGAGFLFNAVEAKDAIANGDWAEGLTHGAVAIMGTVSAIVDPIGTLAAGLASWAMEHLDPLKEALDKLAGNPDAVSAFSQTWDNVGEHLITQGSNLDNTVQVDSASWTSMAVAAYKVVVMTEAALIQALGNSCKGISAAVNLASLVIDTVRCIVRDLVADCVGKVVSAAVEALTVVLIPKAVANIISLVGKYVPKITQWIDKLTRVVNRLKTLMSKLKPILEGAKKLDNAISTRVSSVTRISPSDYAKIVAGNAAPNVVSAVPGLP